MRMERQIQLFKRLLNKWCLQLSGRASDRKSGDRGSTPRRRTTIFQNYILYDLTAWVSLYCSSVPVLGSWVWGSCGPAQEKRSNISFFQKTSIYKFHFVCSLVGFFQKIYFIAKGKTIITIYTHYLNLLHNFLPFQPTVKKQCFCGHMNYISCRTPTLALLRLGF